MILASDLITAIRRNGLDADDSDFYDVDRNIIPAINSAVRWVVSVYQAALSQKRIREEALGELAVAQVYVTSQTSRIQLNDVWGILAVYPLPTVVDDEGASVAIGHTGYHHSLKLDQVFHKSGNYSAKRMSIEEWADNRKNPFAPSNIINQDCEELCDYGYLQQFDYVASADTPDAYTTQNMIEIRPALVNKYCTVFELQVPEAVTADTDEIKLNKSLFNLITQKAVQYISYQQGDGTNLYSVTSKDVMELVAAVS